MDRRHIVTQPLAQNFDGSDENLAGELPNGALEIDPTPSDGGQLEEQSAECPEATIDFEGATTYKGLDYYCDNEADEDDVEEIVFGEEPAEGDSVDATMPVAVTANAVADEVDDLADYMQNFLQRMKCGTSEEVTEEVETEIVETPEEPANLYAGPKAAPECKSDLQAMREVALASANDSLSRHDQTIVSKTKVALVVAVCFWIVSATIAAFASEMVGYSFIAAVVCAGVATFFTSGYLLGLRKLNSSERSNQPNPEASQSHE